MTEATTRTDAYAVITDKVIAALEQGTIPWRKPWRAGGADVARNGITHRPYTGINVWTLALAGYESNRWVTVKQANAAGTFVKKGEKATPVTFWKPLEYVKFDDETGRTEKRRGLMLKWFNVFNAEQLADPDALPRKRGEAEAVQGWDAVEKAEAIVQGYRNAPAIRHAGGDRAFYTPSLDAITLPKREQFDEAGEYYSTLFHELAHSTGHESRLKRIEPCHAPFGSPTYAREELVAELGSSYLCALAGIDNTLNNSAAYLKGWLKALENDRRLLVNAASAAHKAANWVIGAESADDADEE